MANIIGEVIGKIVTLLGYDGTAFRNVAVDEAGQLQVDVVTAGLPTGAATQTTLAALLDKWPGTPISIKTTYLETKTNFAAGVGFNFLYNTAVPVGEIWVIQACRIFNATSATTEQQIIIIKGANQTELARNTAAIAGQRLRWDGQATFTAGYQIAGFWWGCTAGDDLFMDICGYKMDVT